jgi:hypothetical protein
VQGVKEVSVTSIYWKKGQPILNFGEHFAELIPSRLFGTKFNDHAYTGLLTISSEFIPTTLGHFKQVIVWGAANGYGKSAAVKDLSKWDVWAVRDELTRSYIDLDVPVCDPIFLSRELWDRRKRLGKVLHAPHWHETSAVIHGGKGDLKPKDLEIFDPRIHVDDFEQSVQRLLGAEFVLCGALHVFLFCLAMEVPCAPYVHTQRDKPHKWNAMAKTLGVPLDPVADLEAGRIWWDKWYDSIRQPDTEALKKAYQL